MGGSLESYKMDAFVRNCGASVFSDSFNNSSSLFVCHSEKSNFVCFVKLSVYLSVVGIVSWL